MFGFHFLIAALKALTVSKSLNSDSTKCHMSVPRYDITFGIKNSYAQRTQTSLRRLQDVLKRSRRLTTKQDVVTTSGKRRLIYDILKTSDLRRLEDVKFTTS